MSEAKAGVTAQLIDDLLASGTPVDEGQFTIDSAAAARKMEAFRYGDADRYLLPLVEALHLLDCREVAIEREGEDLVIRASNVDLSEVEETLLDIYSHAIGDNANGALARLAIAMDMALSDEGNQWIALTYSNTARSYAAVYKSREAPTLVEDHPKVIRELRLFIDRPWRDRLVGDPEQVLGHLRQAVRYSARPVKIDGELVSQQARKHDALEVFAGEGFRLRIVGAELEATEGEGFRMRVSGGSAHARSIAELWSAGLHLDTLELEGRGVHAVIELEAPKRDLSQMGIIRDECVETALAKLEELVPDPPPEQTYKSLPELMKERRERLSEASTEDSDADEAASESVEVRTHLVPGLLIWAFGLLTGTKLLAVVVNYRNEAGLSVDMFFALGGLAATWTLILSWLGVMIAWGEEQPSWFMGAVSLALSIFVALSLSGGCA